MPMTMKTRRLFKFCSSTDRGIYFEMTDPANTTKEHIQELCDAIDIDGLSWKAIGHNLIAFFRDPMLCTEDDEDEEEEEEDEDEDDEEEKHLESLMSRLQQAGRLGEVRNA